MAKLSILFLVTLGLQCFFWKDVSCRSTTFKITLESFARQDRAGKFLQTIYNGTKVSFTGEDGHPSTKFILKREPAGSNFHYTLHPAEMPHYILAADNGKLVVKNSTMDTVDKNYKLEKAWVTLEYKDSTNKKMNVSYDMLRFLSSPGKVIKSNCNGEVFLDKRKNGLDSQAWIKIN